MRGEHIEEFEGSYGPIVVGEKLLQRFWHNQAIYLTGLRTTDGVPVKIHYPGQWNFREGPDFLRAQFTLNGKFTEGDVEIHFHANDWFLHGHHEDPNYQNVQLHVTLSARKPPHTDSGYYPPHQLIMMDFLHSDLEQLMETDYLNQFIYPPPRTSNPRRWHALSPEQRRAELIRRARFRLRQKTQKVFIQQNSSSIQETCHLYFLEILGYPLNRAPFIEIARRFPIETFHHHSAESMWESVNGWKTWGIRPAGHPWKRLCQYWQFVCKNPDWPQRALSPHLPRIPASWTPTEPGAIHYLRQQFLYPWIRDFHKIISWQPFSNGLKQNLLINLLLPLHACRAAESAWAPWFAMPVGLLPNSYRQWLKLWSICPQSGYPMSNGWLQGTIHLFEHETTPAPIVEPSEHPITGY